MNDAKILQLYKINRNECIILLLTFYEKTKGNRECSKPEMIEFYNFTKGTAATLDKMHSNRTYSRETLRWPLCVFYGMVNIILMNVHVTFVHNIYRKSEKALLRKNHAVKLSEEFLAP